MDQALLFNLAGIFSPRVRIFLRYTAEAPRCLDSSDLLILADFPDPIKSLNFDEMAIVQFKNLEANPRYWTKWLDGVSLGKKI